MRRHSQPRRARCAITHPRGARRPTERQGCAARPQSPQIRPAGGSRAPATRAPRFAPGERQAAAPQIQAPAREQRQQIRGVPRRRPRHRPAGARWSSGSPAGAPGTGSRWSWAGWCWPAALTAGQLLGAPESAAVRPAGRPARRSGCCTSCNVVSPAQESRPHPGPRQLTRRHRRPAPAVARRGRRRGRRRCSDCPRRPGTSGPRSAPAASPLVSADGRTALVTFQVAGPHASAGRHGDGGPGRGGPGAGRPSAPDRGRGG